VDRWNTIEKEMLPRDLEELATMRARLLELGFSRAKVAGCLEFLLGKARGEEVAMATNSKSTYRKMLAALAGAPDRPPDQSGFGSVALLAAVAGVLGTVGTIVVGHPHLAVAAAPIIPDSVNDQDEVAEPGNCCWEPPVLLAA
jgi:hypothetical protein